MLHKIDTNQSRRYVEKYFFFCAILLFMGVVVEYPITMHIDNVVAI